MSSVTWCPMLTTFTSTLSLPTGSPPPPNQRGAVTKFKKNGSKKQKSTSLRCWRLRSCTKRRRVVTGT
jgi:hypothetical protein